MIVAGPYQIAQVHYFLGAQVTHHQAGHPVVVIKLHRALRVLQVPPPVVIVIHQALHQVAVDIALRIVFR